MTVKLLTFDLDDTLWPCKATILKTEERLHQWFSIHHPEITFRYSVQELRQKRIALLNSHQHLAHDLSAIRKKSFAEISKELNYSPAQEQKLIDEAFDLYITERNKVNLYEDVIPTLNQLKQNYRLAAVSNGNADIYLVGLGHLFDFSWSAADAGAQKPHPIIFKSLLKQHRLAADEVIHIGDDPLNDVQGAHNAGIRSIWLNRSHFPWPEEINRPLYEIDHLSVLPHKLIGL